MAVVTDEDENEWAKQEAREKRLNNGIAGVHAVVPVQCEVCWFRNLEDRDPNPRSAMDKRYLMCIRRATLDAIAGKARGTVEAHVRRIGEMLRNCNRIGKTPQLEARGPFPLTDLVGMSLAVDMLMYSLHAKGRINDYIQFDTMRQMRSTYTRLWSSSPRGIGEGSAFSGNAAKFRLTSCPSQSEWFGDFLLGAEDRMGYDTKKQLYLNINVIVEQLRLIKRDAVDGTGGQSNLLFKFGAYLCILTAASLRGHEGMYLDLSATRRHLFKGRYGQVPEGLEKKKILTEAECSNLPEVCICLIGKFKGETGERHHSIVLANESTSGLETRWWVEKLIDVCESEGRTSGPAFETDFGPVFDASEGNALVRQYLREIQLNSPDLFEMSEDLSRFGVSRTYRKSSESRARRAGIKKEDCQVMNRWKTIEQSKGKRPRQAMVDHYSDARALASLTWRYSYAL